MRNNTTSTNTDTYTHSTAHDKQLFVIAIGASAGGVEALQDFLVHLPELPNTCLLIAQHLSPTHTSQLVELLSKETTFEEGETAHGVQLEAGKIYITPPDVEITVEEGRIHFQKPTETKAPKPSIDILFASMAVDLGNRAIAVVLSGNGNDGSEGIKAIKSQGGFVIAQDPETAQNTGMPLAAIETGVVDQVVIPSEMGTAIAEHLALPIILKAKSADDTSAFEKITELLSKGTGTDISNYKTATIKRRLEKRLNLLHIDTLQAYLQELETNPRELGEMYNMILIGVTKFFRDREAFVSLEKTLRLILDQKTNKEPIRIWVPGCSTGEEAYTISILLHQILHDRAGHYNIQIFATDTDEKAIAKARKGLYDAETVAHLPAPIVQQYFTLKGDIYEVTKEVRSMVLFSRHDITNNPPFLKLDLISCRNLLIYFNTVLQQQIIPIFHYSLNQDGYLFLGKSETPGQYSDLFKPVDEKNKIFQRKRGGKIAVVKFSAYKNTKTTPAPDFAIGD